MHALLITGVPAVTPLRKNPKPPSFEKEYGSSSSDAVVVIARGLGRDAVAEFFTEFAGIANIPDDLWKSVYNSKISARFEICFI